jgi:hypothetical protein
VEQSPCPHVSDFSAKLDALPDAGMFLLNSSEWFSPVILHCKQSLSLMKSIVPRKSNLTTVQEIWTDIIGKIDQNPYNLTTLVVLQLTNLVIQLNNLNSSIKTVLLSRLIVHNPLKLALIGSRNWDYYPTLAN